MKKQILGCKDDYITYLNENKKMDRSLMSFNLQNIYGISKKTAGVVIREWYDNK